jgi:hypothetical protein
MVVKKKGSYYYLYSKTTGRLLGKYRTKAQVLKRERQIHYFKKKK